MAEPFQPPVGASIGIIIPPPGRKKVIDKTAAFVATKGRHVEEEIFNNAQAKSASNFTFLLEDDPFHAYYLAMVAEFASAAPAKSEGNTGTATTTTAATPSATHQHIDGRTIETGKLHAHNAETISSAPVLRSTNLVDALRSSSKRKGQEPPPFEFSLEKPLDVSILQLELMKLAAQFAATDGKKFESDLFHKEKVNEKEFAFLNANHHHHSYYSELVRCYRQLLDNSVGWIADLSSNESVLLERVIHRFEYRRDEALKRIETDEKKAIERLAFLEIDWHDFVVVETIRFEEETMDAPASIGIEQLVAEAADAARRAVDLDDVDLGEIRRDYRVEPVRATLSVPMVTLPDGRQVPVSEMNEQVRVDLLDPTKFREQQEKFEKRQRETNLVEGGSMPKHLARLAGARWDVFGGEREESERRLEERKRNEASKIVWDGNMLTADSTRAAVAVNNKQRGSGFPSQPFTVAPMLPPPLPPSAVSFPPPPPSISGTKEHRHTAEGPDSKRVKISAEVGQGKYRILVPAGGPGGIGPDELEIPCSLNRTVNELKELISGALSNVAVSKFQLKTTDGKFLKNSDELGAVSQDSPIEVKWKSR